MLIIEPISGISILASFGATHESVDSLLTMIFGALGLVLVIGLIMGIYGVVKQNHNFLLAASIVYFIRTIVSIIRWYFFYETLDNSSYIAPEYQDDDAFVAAVSVISSILLSIPCLYTTYILKKCYTYYKKESIYVNDQQPPNAHYELPNINPHNHPNDPLLPQHQPPPNAQYGEGQRVESPFINR